MKDVVIIRGWNLNSVGYVSNNNSYLKIKYLIYFSCSLFEITNRSLMQTGRSARQAFKPENPHIFACG